MLGIHWLREAFEKAVPGYDKGVTVPAIVDIPAGAVVTADFRQITLDMEHEWSAYHRAGAPDLYPEPLRAEIEEVSAGIYTDLNNGVYRCGFATTQAAYEEAYRVLFARLDSLSEAARYPALPDRRHDHRGRHPALAHAEDPGSTPSTTATSSVQPGTRSPRCRCCGRTPVTCSRSPGFGDTIDFAQTKQHYYRVHTNLNPSQIVAALRAYDLSGCSISRTTGRNSAS